MFRNVESQQGLGVQSVSCTDRKTGTVYSTGNSVWWFVTCLLLLVLEAPFALGGLSRHHQLRPMVIFSWFASTPRLRVPASLHLLALQLMPSMPNLRAPQRHYWFKSRWRDGDARDRSLIGRGVLIVTPIFGPCCRSVGAQSATQPWRSDPMTADDS